MNRLFRITGYLKQDKTWCQTEPSLVGKVIMGELPIFWGCCKEYADGDTMKADATSFIVGGFPRNERVGFFLYKMYDQPPKEMMLLMAPSLKEVCNVISSGERRKGESRTLEGYGMWATPEKDGGDFVERNPAWFKIERIADSEELEREIDTNFRNGCPILATFPDELAKAAQERR